MQLVAVDELPWDFGAAREPLILIACFLAPLCAVVLLVRVAPLDFVTSVRRGSADDLAPAKVMVPLLRESSRALLKEGRLPSFHHRDAGRDLAALPRHDKQKAEPPEHCIVEQPISRACGASLTTSPSATRRAAAASTSERGSGAAPPAAAPPRAGGGVHATAGPALTLSDDRTSSHDVLLARSASFEEERLQRTMHFCASHEGRQSLMAAERMQHLADARQRRQVGLMRVLALLFPPLTRVLPLPPLVDDGDSVGHSSWGGAGVGGSNFARRARGVPPAGGCFVPSDSAGRNAGGGTSPLGGRSGSVAASQSAEAVPPRLLGDDGEIEEDETAQQAGLGCILEGELRVQLTAQLPPALALRDWHLRYSTECHGCSLRTMYQRCAHAAAPTILVVLDAQGARFGGFATERWAPGARYCGTGESFLFRVEPPMPTGRTSSQISFYPWSGANTHFQLAFHDSIAMGGGGHFGLWLDEAFEFGSSGRSETFGNPPLGSDESFRVLRVEVWELAAPSPLSPLNSPRLSDYDALASPLASPRIMDHGGDGAAGPLELAPPVIEAAARQGSSAFLVNLLGTGRSRID